MPTPVADTLSAGGDFRAVEGPLGIRQYLVLPTLPAASTFPTGTLVRDSFGKLRKVSLDGKTWEYVMPKDLFAYPRGDYSVQQGSLTALTPTIVYVRPTGNDTTGDGTTVGTAYLTIDRALQDIPTVINGAFYVIDVSGYGTYTTANPVALEGFVGPKNSNYGALPVANGGGSFYCGDVLLFAAPTTVDTLNLPTTTQAADSVTQLITITDTSKAWTPGALVGKFYAEYTASGLNGVYPIYANTATTLTYAYTYSLVGNVILTSAEIVSPSTTIHFTDPNSTYNSAVVVQGNEASIGMFGVAIDGGVTGIAAITNVFDGGHVYSTMVDSGGLYAQNSTLQVNGCYFHSPTNNAANSDASLDITDQSSLLVYGMYCKDLYVVLPGDPGCSPPLVYGLRLEGSDPWGLGFGDEGPSQAGLVEDASITGASGHGFYVYRGTHNYLRYATVSSSAGSGVFVDRNCSIMLRNPISGTGNAGYGVLVDGGGQVVTDFGSTFTITGTLGDFKVGLRPPRTWVHFGSTAPVGNENDFGGMGCRLWEYQGKNNTFWAVSAIITAAGYTPRLWETVRVDPTAGGFASTLPTAVGYPGMQVKYKYLATNGNVVTIGTTGGQTIDGAASYPLTSGVVTFESDGANWMVV